MSEAFTNVKTGQVTYAVRDTSIDGVEIHKDDFYGIGRRKNCPFYTSTKGSD